MNKLIICLFSLFLFVGCGDDEGPNPDVQIADFIASEGLEVTTTASGLNFVFQEEGTGDLPIVNSIMELTFTGMLTDGTIFSQSTSPIEAYITNQIEGLKEGLSMMRKGSRATFIIPPSIGFGSEGIGDVPGNSAIVYQIQVSKVDNRIQNTIDQYIEDNNLEANQTEEGLYYVLSEEGEGQGPNINSDIEINYTGRFVDGGVFDQSGASSANFPLSNLIRGWQIGIPLMGVGGVGEFIIPPQLAYGQEGRTGIPGDAVLIFDIELISF